MWVYKSGRLADHRRRHQHHGGDGGGASRGGDGGGSTVGVTVSGSRVYHDGIISVIFYACVCEYCIMCADEYVSRPLAHFAKRV
jgi:hypothetical protein